MLFEEVIPAFREGKKIRCKSWASGFTIDLITLEVYGCSEAYNELLTVFDILDEWEIVLDEHEYSPFPVKRKGGINGE